ncbi:MAG: hypothetical protein QX196_11320 [Methylococcaceae bacterium]
MAKVGIRQDHHERLNFKLSGLTWIAEYWLAKVRLNFIATSAALCSTNDVSQHADSMQ